MLLILHRIDISAGRKSRYCAVGGGGGDLSYRLGAAISRDEDAGKLGHGHTILARLDIAVAIELYRVGKGLVLGNLTDSNEDAVDLEGATRIGLRSMAPVSGFLIFTPEITLSPRSSSTTIE